MHRRLPRSRWTCDGDTGTSHWPRTPSRRRPSVCQVMDPYEFQKMPVSCAMRHLITDHGSSDAAQPLPCPSARRGHPWLRVLVYVKGLWQTIPRICRGAASALHAEPVAGKGRRLPVVGVQGQQARLLDLRPGLHLGSCSLQPRLVEGSLSGSAETG